MISKMDSENRAPELLSNQDLSKAKNLIPLTLPIILRRFVILKLFIRVLLWPVLIPLSHCQGKFLCFLPVLQDRPDDCGAEEGHHGEAEGHG